MTCLLGCGSEPYCFRDLLHKQKGLPVSYRKPPLYLVKNTIQLRNSGIDPINFITE
jgi:hypothetical protein